MVVVSHQDEGNLAGWALLVRSGRIVIAVRGGLSAPFSARQAASHVAGYSAAPYVVAGKWAHVAATSAGRTLRLYYDGVLRGSDNSDALFSRSAYRGPLCLGRGAGLVPTAYAGQLDDVRISTVARYTGNAAPKPTAALPVDSTTVALWRFNEPNGTALIDAASHGHTGLLAPAGAAPARVAATCIPSR